MAKVSKYLIKDYFYQGVDYPMGTRQIPEELAKLIDNDIRSSEDEVALVAIEKSEGDITQPVFEEAAEVAKTADGKALIEAQRTRKADASAK